MFVRHAALFVVGPGLHRWAAFGSHQASAQEVSIHRDPSGWVDGFSPGAATDIMARLVAAGLQAEIGQPVIVENRPGSQWRYRRRYAAKAAPDGYTLMFNSTAPRPSARFLRRPCRSIRLRTSNCRAFADAKQVIACEQGARRHGR